VPDVDFSSGEADPELPSLVGQWNRRIINPVLQDHLELPVVVPLLLPQLPHIRVLGVLPLVLSESETVGHQSQDGGMEAVDQDRRTSPSVSFLVNTR